MHVLCVVVVVVTVCIHVWCVMQASRMEPCCCVRISGVGTPDKAQSAGVLYRIVKNYYAPFLLSKWMRPIVVSPLLLLCRGQRSLD